MANTYEIFMKLIENILIDGDGNEITLNLNEFAETEFEEVEYDVLFLNCEIRNGTVELSGEWDLEDLNEDSDSDVPPCDIYDNRFSNFLKIFEKDFEIVEVKTQLRTNSLLIEKVILKMI